MKSLAIAYAMKKKAKAKGGEVKGVHAQGEIAGHKMKQGTSLMGDAARKGHNWAQQDSRRNLKELKEMPNPKIKGLADGGPVLDPDKLQSTQDSMRKAFKFAEGGEVNQEIPMISDSDKDDIVDRIMRKQFSYGGQVANETDIDTADEMPAQFDDLVLRDGLESEYDGSNAGDHLGNEQEDEDQSDLVARIMSSRRKKDRNPRPA